MKKIKITIMAAAAGLLLTLSATSAMAADVSIKFVLGLPIPFLTVSPAPSVVYHHPAPFVYHRPAPVVIHRQAPVVLHRPAPAVAVRPPQYGYGQKTYVQQRGYNTGYAVRR